MPQSDVPGEWSLRTQPFPTKPPPFARQSFTEKDINPYATERGAGGDPRAAEEFAAMRDCLRRPACADRFRRPATMAEPIGAAAAVDPTKGLLYIVSQGESHARQARASRTRSRRQRRRKRGRRALRGAAPLAPPPATGGRQLHPLQLADQLHRPEQRAFRHGAALVKPDRLRSQHRDHQVAGSQRRRSRTRTARPQRYRRAQPPRRARGDGRRLDLRHHRVRP